MIIASTGTATGVLPSLVGWRLGSLADWLPVLSSRTGIVRGMMMVQIIATAAARAIKAMSVIAVTRATVIAVVRVMRTTPAIAILTAQAIVMTVAGVEVDQVGFSVPRGRPELPSQHFCATACAPIYEGTAAFAELRPKTITIGEATGPGVLFQRACRGP